MDLDALWPSGISWVSVLTSLVLTKCFLLQLLNYDFRLDSSKPALDLEGKTP